MTPKRLTTDLSASVHQRLLNRSRETGRPFGELLQYFGMERFLYRLTQSPFGHQFVLKGGLMLLVWEGPSSRPTRDIDLLGRINSDPDAVAEVFRAICCQQVVDDGLTFDHSTVRAQAITGQTEYQGVRVKLRAHLGRSHVPIQVDVGFGDLITPEELTLTYPTLLDFPAPRLRTYTRETLVAEKLEAMVRYGELTSRMNDFYDLWLLSRQFTFDGELLSLAIQRTFLNRHTPVVVEPPCLTGHFGTDAERQRMWKAYTQRNRLLDAPDQFVNVVTALAAFLGPVLAALASHTSFTESWSPPGPWAPRPT